MLQRGTVDTNDSQKVQGALDIVTAVLLNTNGNCVSSNARRIILFLSNHGLAMYLVRTQASHKLNTSKTTNTKYNSEYIIEWSTNGKMNIHKILAKLITIHIYSAYLLYYIFFSL